MLLADNQRIQLTRGGIQRVYSRVDTQGRDVTGQYHGRIKVSEGGGRRRVSQVVRRYVYGLNGGDGTGLGGGNTLLQNAHLFSQSRLITYRGRHTTQQSGYFGTGQGVTVDVVDEQQNVTTFVTELLGHSQTGQCYAQTVTRRLVHLAVYQSYLVQYVGVLHLVIEVVTFTSTLTHTGEYRVTAVLDRDVTDQLHHVDGLAYTGTTEQTNLTALGKRADQVDNFDAGFQQLVGASLLVVARSRAVDTPALFFADRASFVNRVTQHVHDTAQGLDPDRHGDGCTGVGDGQTALDTFGGTHGDGTYDAITQLLLDFQGQTLIGHLQRVIHLRHVFAREFHVDDGADDLNDTSATHLLVPLNG